MMKAPKRLDYLLFPNYGHANSLFMFKIFSHPLNILAEYAAAIASIIKTSQGILFLQLE